MAPEEAGGAGELSRNVEGWPGQEGGGERHQEAEKSRRPPLALHRGSHFAWLLLRFSGLSLEESQSSSPPLTGKQNRYVGEPWQTSLTM